MPWSMSPEEIVKEVADGLKVTLTVGAARACIDDDQEWLDRLQSAVRLPLGIYQTTGDPEHVLRAVQDVMGPGWAPPGDWARYIEAASRFHLGQSG